MYLFKRLSKRWLNSDNRTLRAIAGLFKYSWVFLCTLKVFFVNSEYRSIQMLKIFHHRNVHQTTPSTTKNRYPDTFIECVKYFGKRDNLRLLSFGCSTGEEVLTLRMYFPNAEIVGVDINKRNLRVCRKLKTDENITFAYSSPKNLIKLGPFDAVFCMAVFQRTPHYIADQKISDISKIYPFEKFENQLVYLSQLVNPLGLLVTHFTQYSFEDTSIASKFTAVNNHTQEGYCKPVFDKHGKILVSAPPFHSIFAKLPDCL